MTDFSRLKEDILRAIDIKGFYEKNLAGQVLTEKADGWSDRVYCPIHKDQKTPNFFVQMKTGGFHCHSCGAKGSIFDFWIRMQGLSPDDKSNFVKSMAAMAELAGIDVREWKEKNKDALKDKRTPQQKNQEENFIPRVNKAESKDSTTKPISHSVVVEMQKALRPEHYAYLNQKRGLTAETIKDWEIGFNVNSGGKTPDGDIFKGRYAIPVFNRKDEVRNIRQHSDKAEPKTKVINMSGYGAPARLLGLNRMLKENWEYVILCEGEYDAMLLNQELKKFGLSSWGALSGTHGANTFEPEWVPDFFGRHLFFCFDCDDAGKAAAASHASKFLSGPLSSGKFRSLKLLELPLDGSKESKDITDYFVKHGFTVEDFIKLVNDTPDCIVGGIGHDETTVEAIPLDDFVLALKDRRYIDQRVTVPITISGQSSRIYHAVRSYKVTNCPRMHGKKDEVCCNIETGERLIPYGNELFIQSCMAARSVVYGELCRIACQNPGQKGIEIEVTKKVVMEEYFAHQVVQRWKVEEDNEGRMRNAQELVQSSVYILQPKETMDIGPQNYMATGWVRTDPRSQNAAFFVETLVPMEDDWRKFTLERDEYRQAIQEIKEWKTDDILKSITEHVTKIYDADDILYVILLTFLSPMAMSFNGSYLRAWINSAIIGDSGTGKSRTYQRIADWIDMGDLFSALSGTRTGLLYAIKQKGGEWHVSIGRYVQASGKIIAVDETQETEPEDIKRMAIAMDTGWLEVSQVASGGYRTRTRTLFLMNAKRGRTISDYAYGCSALRECFDPMFIRRLDIALVVGNKHDHEFYNQRAKVEESSVPILQARLFKALIYWAWTRSIDNIIWRDDAVDECLNKSNELTAIYGYTDEIPLVSPQDFRNNLARLAVSYAILDRNFTPDLQSVIIEPRHVQGVATLLDLFYSSPACNLRQVSKLARRKNMLEDYDKIKTNFEQIIEHTRRSPNPEYAAAQHFLQLVLLLQQLEYIRKKDLKEQLGVSLMWIQKRLSMLQAYNMVEVYKNGYRTTRKFNLFMREWQQERGVEKMLEEVHSHLGSTAGLNDHSNEWLGIQTGDERDESDFDFSSKDSKDGNRRREPDYVSDDPFGD